MILFTSHGNFKNYGITPGVFLFYCVLSGTVRAQMTVWTSCSATDNHETEKIVAHEALKDLSKASPCVMKAMNEG